MYIGDMLCKFQEISTMQIHQQRGENVTASLPTAQAQKKRVSGRDPEPRPPVFPAYISEELSN
jgi:hypothetical protein